MFIILIFATLGISNLTTGYQTKFTAWSQRLWLLPLAHHRWCLMHNGLCRDTCWNPWIRLPSATCWSESCCSLRTHPNSLPGSWNGTLAWSSFCGCAISDLLIINKQVIWLLSNVFYVIIICTQIWQYEYTIKNTVFLYSYISFP